MTIGMVEGKQKVEDRLDVGRMTEALTAMRNKNEWKVMVTSGRKQEADRTIVILLKMKMFLNYVGRK